MNDSFRKRIRVVMMPKWYPDRKDPQLGVFIQKHARCIALHAEVTVFHARSDDRLSAGTIESETRQEQGVEERLYYYGPYGKSPFSTLMNGLLYLRCWWRFKKSVSFSKNKPDLLHAYILLRTGMIARFESVISGIPYVVSEQWSGYVTGKFDRQNPIKRSLTRQVLRKAAGVSAVSRFLKSSLERISGRNDIQVFHNIIEPFVAVKPGNQNYQPFILVVADLVDEIKNISGVIRAFHESTTDKTDLQLRIIGGGKDHRFLEDYARKLGLGPERCHFEGMQPNEEVYKRLTSCEFLVMNSRFETFSSVCAEALVCGKPVIATRCGGPQEFITPECGILIGVDNDLELRDAMTQMMQGLDRYPADKLREYALQRFGRERIGSGFHDWYRGIGSARCQ